MAALLDEFVVALTIERARSLAQADRYNQELALLSVPVRLVRTPAATAPVTATFKRPTGRDRFVGGC